MGHVDMARLVVPRNVRDARIDLAARQPLYAAGLDFLHGTGHGIGSFLGVHESQSFHPHVLDCRRAQNNVNTPALAVPKLSRLDVI